MNQMMKVTLINDIVQIIKDHRNEDLVYQTSNLEKKSNPINEDYEYYPVKFVD
jgi:hypothetical protein